MVIKHTDKTKNLIKETKLNKLLTGDFSNLYHKKPFKVIKNIICKNNYEKNYILNLAKYKQDLPQNTEKIITPSGQFIPSFEVENYYIVNWWNTTGLIFYKSSEISEQIKWIVNNKKPIMLLINRIRGEVIYKQLITKDNLKDIKQIKEQCKIAIEKDEVLEEEKKLQKQLKSEKLLKHWETYKDTKEYEERTEKIKSKATGRTRSQESRDKQALANTGKKMSIETKQKRAKNRIEKMLRGETVGVRCKIFVIAGLACQGTFEKGYIEELITNNKELPINGKGVNTPFGLYSPDFDFPDYYIEIKSQFTYKIFTGKIENINGHFCNGQRQKAIWTTQNVKPVIVLVYDKPGKLAFTEDLSILKSTLV